MSTLPDQAGVSCASDTEATFCRRIPHDFARRHGLAPNGRQDGALRLLVTADTPPSVIHATSVRMRTPVTAETSSPEAIAAILDRIYTDARGDQADDDADLASNDQREGADLERLIAATAHDLLDVEGKGPVVQLVDTLLFDASQAEASDLHVQPTLGDTLIRRRIDGVLLTHRTLPARLAAPVASRIKVMAGLDIAERRLPQDGRATVTIGAGRRVDLRVSTMPTNFGERVVVRLLDKASSARPMDFAELGMSDAMRSRYLACVERTSGVVLVTGPTGSGKTTTLYATLRWAATRDETGLNVMTVEDPIEYELASDGVPVSQSQINTKKGMTFAKGLRHLLRQDPDVVMVGEIRDQETASVAVQASLTGHLVLSTLHTNDAASAVTRLIDLNVDASLVAASLNASIAQRLVRRTHAPCNGAGCDDCAGTGYRGRVGLYELLVADRETRRHVADGAELDTLRAEIERQGGETLAQAGARLRDAGLTTDVELRRVLSGDTSSDLSSLSHDGARA
ncbi:MAG: GspE/PulE family protein [Planctomycetota bacterium]